MLYENGLIAIDEARSAFSIPGGETLPQPAVQMQERLRTLCTRAKYRVLMDADVSADGAVETGLCIIAPMFDVLHVQLQRAALKRVLSLSFTGPKGSTGKADWEARLTLWLQRVRWVRDEWVGAQRAKMHVASVVLWLLERQWAREDGANGAPSAEVESERQRQRAQLRRRASTVDVARAYAVRWLLKLRERQAATGDTSPLLALLRDRGKAARFDRQRVLVCCATPQEEREVAKMCDKLGAAYQYSGTTSDIEKRAHFKDTTAYWFDAAVVIASTTMTVAVNVRIHFSAVFLWCRRAEQAGRLRELFQAIVRVGRDEDDPLEDEHVYTLMPGEPPDFSKFKPMAQEFRFQSKLRELKGESATVLECERAARSVYQRMAGDFDEPSVALDDSMIKLLACNRLEGQDNCGDAAVVKAVELCKLPTRAWPVELTRALAPVERAESDALAQEEAPLLPDEAEDRRVGKSSIAKNFEEWLHPSLDKQAAAAAAERAADATFDVDDDTLADWTGEEKRRLEEAYFAEQESFRYSEVARPGKDAREIAKEKIFEVIEPLGYLPRTDAFPGAGSGWFGKLAQDDTMGKLAWRAAASVMPLDEQRKVGERLRREGKTAHQMVRLSWDTRTTLLQQLANVLELSTDGRPDVDRLLKPTTFTGEDAWVKVRCARERLCLPSPGPRSPLEAQSFALVSTARRCAIAASATPPTTRLRTKPR